MQRWFYYNVSLASPLHSTNRDIAYVLEPKTEIMEDQFTSRLALLPRVTEKMSMRDLVEEFTMLRIQPLQMGWNCVFEQGAEEWPKVYPAPPPST